MPRPQQPGLTENELEVMQVLWAESPLKVGQILERLARVKKPAYTSLMTLVHTMERKGYIAHRQSGKAFVYLPKLKEASFKNSELKRVSRRLFNGSPLALVMNLVEDRHLSPLEIKQLKQTLEEK